MAGGGRNLIPPRIPLGEAGIHAAVLERVERTVQQFVDLAHRGPYVAQVDRPSIDVGQRFARQVDIDSARERERHDEWRTHEKVRLHALVDARLEVAVS